MKNQKVETAINKVVEVLRTGDIKTIAYAAFHGKNTKPSDNWSFLNRLLMLASGTEDARGYNQWQNVGRNVKKSAKAIYILAPLTYTKKSEEEKEEPTRVLRGYRTLPVFRVENTEGKPLEEDKFDLKIPGNLLQVVDDLGVIVNEKAFNGSCWGSFSAQQKEIVLMTPELSVYLHELAHVVDNTINGKLAGGQHADQEITAELSAEVVAYLMGLELNGKSKEYIDYYTNMNWKQVFKLLNRVNKVVSYIVEHAKIERGCLPSPSKGG